LSAYTIEYFSKSILFSTNLSFVEAESSDDFEAVSEDAVEHETKEKQMLISGSKAQTLTKFFFMFENLLSYRCY
ncbi:MAG: hypothetical protein WCS34_10045, partial [Bacteroidales bacterium]